MDRRAGRRLHRQLERFTVPRSLRRERSELPPHVRPVFRDIDDAPATADLSVVINEALDQSEALVVLCSPHAASSKWVNQEVRSFSGHGRADRVFPVIDGDTAEASSLDDCLPEALQELMAPNQAGLPGGPLVVDRRGGRDQRRAGLIRLVAGVIGVGYDDLFQRDARRRRRRVGALLLVSSVIASAMVVLFVRERQSAEEALAQQANAEVQAAEAVRQRGLAEEQAAEAERQRGLAEEQAEIATRRALESRIGELSVRAQDAVTGQPGLAALLALEADALAKSDLHVDQDAPYAALYAVALTPRPTQVDDELVGEVSLIEFGPSGDAMVIGGAARTVLFSVQDPVASVEVLAGPAEFAEFSDDGSVVLASGEGVTSVWTAAGEHLATAPTLLRPDGGSEGALYVDQSRRGLSPAGSHFITTELSDVVKVRVHDLDRGTSAVMAHTDDIEAAAFAPSGGLVVTLSQGAVRGWTGGGDLVWSIDLAQPDGNITRDYLLEPIAFTSEGNYVGIDTAAAGWLAVEVATGEAVAPADDSFDTSQTLIETDTGVYYARWTEDHIELVGLDGGVLAQYPRMEDQWLGDISPDESLVVLEGIGRRVDVFTVDGEQLGTVQLGEDVRARFSPQSSWVYVWAVGPDFMQTYSPSGQLIATFEDPPAGPAPPFENMFGVSGDERYAYFSYQLWDLRPDRPPAPPESAAVPPTGGRVEVVSPDGSWRLQEGQLRDGMILLSYLVVDRVGAATGEVFHDAGVAVVRFSPDSSLIASLGENGIVSLWTASGTWIADLPVDDGATDLAFSVDSDWLTVLYGDGHATTHRIWDRDEVVAEVQTRAPGREPTDFECRRFEFEGCSS